MSLKMCRSFHNMYRQFIFCDGIVLINSIAKKGDNIFMNGEKGNILKDGRKGVVIF